jgi:hypothetical protein
MFSKCLPISDSVATLFFIPFRPKVYCDNISYLLFIHKTIYVWPLVLLDDSGKIKGTIWFQVVLDLAHWESNMEW